MTGSMAAPRIERVEVKPNPAPLEAGKRTEVLITVTIERPTPMDLNCDAVVDAGDGSRFVMTWGIGERRTKTARYEYSKAGTYRLSVSGTGKDACVGLKELTVTVGAPGSARQEIKAAPRCPSGWALVEHSVRGARYTCRVRPPAQTLPCAAGTTYFAERDEIGCR